MLAPPGRLSNAMMPSCFDPGAAFCDGFPAGFAFEAFLAALTSGRPRTFFAGFDWAAAIFTEERLLGVGAFLDDSGSGQAVTLRPTFRAFEEGATAPSSG